MNQKEAFGHYINHMQYVSSQPAPFQYATDTKKVASLALGLF